MPIYCVQVYTYIPMPITTILSDLFHPGDGLPSLGVPKYQDGREEEWSHACTVYV